MTFNEIATQLAIKMMEKSGVGEVLDAAARQAITAAAIEMATAIYFDEEGWAIATSKILIPEMDGTPKQICFGDHAADFLPTAANDLRITTDGTKELDVQLAAASLANSTSESTGSIQSAKFDFGAVRAECYRARCAFEIAATPTAGAYIELWLSNSQSATAGTGNEGGASGSAGAYTGYSSNIGASLKQCQYVGEFVCTAQATAVVQVGKCGLVVPRERYGTLIIWNKSGAALFTDDVEIHIVLDPFFPQGQAA